MKVSIVIPNRNGVKLLQKNLPAVLAAGKSAEVMVVDDASTDDSISAVIKEFPSVKIIKKDRHEGYPSTVDFGITQAKGDVIVLLNSDVRPEKNFLAPLLKHFSDPQIFAVGCMDKSIEGEKVVLRGRGVARWEKGMYIHSRGEIDKTDTAWVSGGSGAFRKTIWDKLGGMDPIFNPFYWEDIDISYRALKAGYKILFEPASVVTHEHARGVIAQEYSQLRIKTIAYRNQFLFIWKNISDVWLWVEHIVWTPIRLLQSIFRADIPMFMGYWLALLKLPTLLVRRDHVSRFWKKGDRAILPLST